MSSLKELDWLFKGVQADNVQYDIPASIEDCKKRLERLHLDLYGDLSQAISDYLCKGIYTKVPHCLSQVMSMMSLTDWAEYEDRDNEWSSIDNFQEELAVFMNHLTSMMVEKDHTEFRLVQALELLVYMYEAKTDSDE